VANLIPIVLRAVANNVTPQVFGDDYPTPDGTCIRDYIHVADLADAHVQAAAVTESEQIGNAINIGTGNGDSVLDVITSISRALNQPVPHQVVARRAGDPAELVAAIDKAVSVLNWSASLDLDALSESAVAAQRARKS
jgi:UDP-glucose 4-epimerase